MSTKKPIVLEWLDRVEANYQALLYEARWNRKTAAIIVPRLIELLGWSELLIVWRALSALTTIGPEAHAAAKAIVPHLSADDPRIYHTAAIALACVSLKKPRQAVRPLMEMAKDGNRLKYAMFGLVSLGAGAKSAAPLFAAAYNNKDARIRRLALRGLKETGADARIAVPVLKKALADRSKENRTYAAKILKANYADGKA
jgi:HEAT repeat protein